MNCPQKVRHYLGAFLWKEKYDYAFKLECVVLVTDQYYSCESVAIKKGIIF
jgi:hypothetical protein